MLTRLLSAASSPFMRRYTGSAIAFALSASLANAVPWRPADDKDQEREGAQREESPAEPLWENYPASENLLPAPEPKSVTVSTKQTETRGQVAGWTFRGPSPIPNG